MVFSIPRVSGGMMVATNYVYVMTARPDITHARIGRNIYIYMYSLRNIYYGRSLFINRCFVRGPISNSPPHSRTTRKHISGQVRPAQSDQNLRWLHKELHPWISKRRPVKILIRLRECESSLSAPGRRYVYLRRGSLSSVNKVYICVHSHTQFIELV